MYYQVKVMVLLKLESENPELSFVIRKNPESKIHFRGIKNGIAKGFYDHNDQKRYIVWFGDKPGESSSGSNDNTYDYLNKLQYVSPILALNLINEYFGTAMKEKQDNDTVHKERLVFNSLMNIAPDEDGQRTDFTPFLDSLGVVKYIYTKTDTSEEVVKQVIFVKVEDI